MTVTGSLLSLAWAVAIAFAATAWAQAPAGGTRPGSGPVTGGAKGGTGLSQRSGDEARAIGPSITELVSMRLSQLEEDLNVQPAQRALWVAYRDSVMRMLDDQRRAAGISVSAMAEMSAPKRLDVLADAARNRLTATEDIVDAGKALYAALTPEQRALADRRLALPLATLAGADGGTDLRPRAPTRPPGAIAPP